VVALAVGIAAVLGDEPSAPPEPGRAVAVDVEAFPGVPDPTPPATEAPPTSPRATPPPLLADQPARSDVSPSVVDRLVLGAAPREFVVDIAPELAGIFRTEVVALQGDEGLYEVSLPSGRVRVTDLGFATGQTQMVTSNLAAVIWPTPEGTAQIVSTQRSLSIPSALVDQVSWSPSSDRMYLWEGRSFANGYEPDVRFIDGEPPGIGLSEIDWIDDVDDPARLLALDGGLLREDTGGTYRVGPDGAELVTTGSVIANGPNHLLLRECDAQRACGVVSVGRDGERTEWPNGIPDDVVPQRVAGLSSGGDALLVIGERLSADEPSALQVLELADGSLQPLQASPFFEGFASWDTTGAGIFYADQQLLYFDRFTGEAVVVSEDLPRLRSVRTRRPADTPICEVLEISLPRFSEMEAAGAGNSISAPDATVLDRIVALAPDELRADAAEVATFVNGFVSPAVDESQTVANWPAPVTDGLEALASYASEECVFANR